MCTQKAANVMDLHQQTLDKLNKFKNSKSVHTSSAKTVKTQTSEVDDNIIQELVKSQKVEGYWNLSQNILDLLKLSNEDWLKLQQKFINRNEFSSLSTDLDTVLITMYIVNFFKTKCSHKASELKLIISKAEGSLKKFIPSYTEELLSEI